MSLQKLIDDGVDAVDAGDEQTLAQAVLDLNAKLEAAGNATAIEVVPLSSIADVLGPVYVAALKALDAAFKAKGHAGPIALDLGA